MEYRFKATPFMSVEEKKIIIKQWSKFLYCLSNKYDLFYTDKKGDKYPIPYKYFSNKLYNHLINNCGFKANYSRINFYHTYFTNPKKTVEFLYQFDSTKGCKPVETSNLNWILKEGYYDLNSAMVQLCTRQKKLMRRMRKRVKEAEENAL